MTLFSRTAALRAPPVILWASMVAALGCAAAPSGVNNGNASLLEGLVTLVPHQSPATWLYHPRSLELADLRVVTANSTQLLLTRDGQRWVAGPQGALIGANQVAPEPLVAVSYAASGRAPGWHFLGRSGSMYESVEALGPFLRVSAPPEVLSRVTAAAEVVLGVTARGTLVRSSDAGGTWESVAIEPRVADAVLLPNGAGLVLTVPEGFLTTDDFGGHFKPQKLSTFGATRLYSEGSGVRVEGTLTARRWSAEHPTTWSQEAPHEEPTETAADYGAPVVRANAEALRQGRAVLHEGRYVEVEEQRGKLTILRGAVTEALEATPLSVPACRSPRLEGRGRILYLVCGAVPGKVTRLEFMRSVDGGDNWRAEPYIAFGDGDALRTAVLGEALVVTGTCPPEMAPSGCLPGGVCMRKLSRSKIATMQGSSQKKTAVTTLVPLAVPGLRGPALDVSVSPIGETLLIVGTRSKSDALVLFASNDRGRTFRAEEVSALTQSSASSGRSAQSSDWVEQIKWGQDGYAALTVVDPRTTAASVMIVNQQGEFVQHRAAPTAAARVAGVGLRALAVEPRGGSAWESTDGGNRWRPIGEVPVALCGEEQQEACEPALSCHEQGCLLGRSLSRVGWDGQQSIAQAVALREPSTRLEIVLQAPFSCRIDDDAAWQKVPGGELPDASRASLGHADWFTHDIDWDSASVASYEVALAGDGQVVAHVLFDEKTDPSQWVLYMTNQTEGVAALRARASGSPVEVAWRNLNLGKEIHRRRLPATFEVQSAATKHLARAAKPGLVSIASDGIFVRLEQDESMSPTLFLDSKNGVRVLPPLTWPTRVASGRTEMVQAEGRPLALKLFGGGATVVAGYLDPADKWHATAYAAGLGDPSAFELRQSFDLAYSGGQPNYHLRFIGALGSQAWLFPLQAGERPLGHPTPAPTQRGLSGKGEHCTLQQRGETARVLAPPEAETLHPVVISHSSEPFRALITRTAVLHGSAEEPCLAAFEAESVSATEGEQVRALVRADASAPSWLFRRLVGGEQFEARRMSCELDPELEVPAEVYERTGGAAR